MGMTNIYMGSLRYGPTGKRRKNHAANAVRRKPITSGVKLKTDASVTNRAAAMKAHYEKYPSLMEEQIKNGSFTQGGNSCGKKEPMRYTGTLVKGIATMHKSNAVPVINREEATDIARMRRG